MKIELGKKPTQKIPSSKNPIEEELRIIYKNETGLSALYKRNGEYKESKKYKGWKDVYFAKLHEEVQEESKPSMEITDEELQDKNLLSMVNMTDEMKKYNIQLGKSKKPRDKSEDRECMTCKIIQPVNPETGSCDSCDREPEEEKVPGYDKIFQRRTLFLWNLMSNKMDFQGTPDDDDIEQLTEIKESLKFWLDQEEE